MSSTLRVRARRLLSRSAIIGRSNIGVWPLDYQTRIGRMKVWNEKTRSKRGIYFSRYRDLAPAVIERAEMLLSRLVHSAYWELVATALDDPILCHCAYGLDSTVVTQQGELYMTHLGASAFDLPMRDLRAALDALWRPGAHQGSAMRELVETYVQVRPLTSDELNVYFIDAQFPCKFYKNAEAAFLHHRFDLIGLNEATQFDLDRVEAAAHSLQTEAVQATRTAGTAPTSSIDTRFTPVVSLVPSLGNPGNNSTS